MYNNITSRRDPCKGYFAASKERILSQQRNVMQNDFALDKEILASVMIERGFYYQTHYSLRTNQLKFTPHDRGKIQQLCLRLGMKLIFHDSHRRLPKQRPHERFPITLSHCELRPQNSFARAALQPHHLNPASQRVPEF